MTPKPKIDEEQYLHAAALIGLLKDSKATRYTKGELLRLIELSVKVVAADGDEAQQDAINELEEFFR